MSDKRLYFRYLGISIRSQMQYRGSFLMLTGAQFFAIATEFFALWALFHRFGSLRGWTLPEVGLFYGVTNCAFALGEGIGRGFDQFPPLVKSGDFDRILLRPRGTAVQIAGQEIQLMRIGRLLQGGGVLGWAIGHLRAAWSLSGVLVILSAIAGGACIFFSLFMLQATLAFWTVDSLEIWNTVTYGGNETAQYPLTIYRPWFRRFFTFVVPLACVNYIPIGPLLGRSSGIPPVVAGLAPIGGVAFLLISFQLWNVGVRRYRSTGS